MARGKQYPRPMNFKTCSCCRQTMTLAQWIALPLIGTQVSEADEYGPAVTLELRNCACGSTLAAEV